jgi:aryl-alcohol dehydrogenase-like predicted oxidoreductase
MSEHGTDEAIDLGITFMDNAWEYHEGRAEELDAQYRSFEKAVLPVCREKGIAALGMKMRRMRQEIG